MSNLIDQFDENYDGGIGLNDSIIDLIETSKVDTPLVRQVSDDVVFAVAERALTAGALLPIDVQHFNVIREVTNFLTLASNGAISEAVSKHTDLLPVNHPNSTSTHEFSVSELRQIRSEWIASDPRIEDENVRSIVAAVYGSNPYSLDFYYNLVRLNALADQVPTDLRMRPLLAFGDPYAGKNSFWHRKQRAEGQRRDDEGQFAEMGGGARIYVKMPMGNIISVVGKVAGIPENDPNGVDIEVTGVDGIVGGIYTVPLDKTKFFKAILPEEAVPSGSPVGPGLNVDFIPIEDMVRKDLPTSWYQVKTDSAQITDLEVPTPPSQSYATGDGYLVNAFSNVTDGILKSQRRIAPSIQKRVDEARDKFGALLVNTKGTDNLELGKPVYELISTKRGQPEVVGYAQDWSTVQAMAQAEDKNYPDAENEPIVETQPTKGPEEKPEIIKAPDAGPEEKPETTKAPDVTEDDINEDDSDVDIPLVEDPFDNTPSDWIALPSDYLKTIFPTNKEIDTFLGDITDDIFGYPNLFVHKTKPYTVVTPSNESQFMADPEDVAIGEGDYYSNMWAVYKDGLRRGFVSNWDGVQRIINQDEGLDEGPAIDEKVTKAASKSKVDLTALDENRYKLLEPMNDDVVERVNKDENNKNYINAGGFDSPLGTSGVNEGVLYPKVADLFIVDRNNKKQGEGNIWKDLLQRKGVEAAIDMWDEMLDYPENFTIKQLVTFYHNLNRAFPDKNEKAVWLPLPQQREKIRRAIKALSAWKVPESDYEHLNSKIKNYRLVPYKTASDFLGELNGILENYRPDQTRIGLTFKDKKTVKGSEVLGGSEVNDKEGNFVGVDGGDAILDSDGQIIQVVSVNPATPDDDETEEDVANKLDLVVLRDGRRRAYQLDKDQDVVVYRGTGELPTPENLKRDAEMRAKPEVAKTVAESEDILTGSEGYGDEVGSEATLGKVNDPSEIRNKINPGAVNSLKNAIYAHIVSDKKLYDRAVEIINNPDYYEYRLASRTLDAINALEKRPQGEFTADIEDIEKIRYAIKADDSLSFEEKKELLQNLHTITSAESKILQAKYNLRASSAYINIKEVLRGSDLAAVISEYTELTEVSPGRYKGLCCFHEETTPSLEVDTKNKDSQRFYCYGCKESGDAVNALMKKEGISSKEAMLRLVQKFNIESVEVVLNRATATQIAKKQGFDDIDPELYAPFGTDLVGEGAPTPGLMVEAKAVIENYEINPDRPEFLAWFMREHRNLSYQVWKDLIETWKKPEYAKHRPTLLTNHIPQGQGGPTNRQLSSIERAMGKQILPKEFVQYVMENYSTAKREWFNQIIDVTKPIEDAHDTDVLNYAIRNLRDVKGLRQPPNFTGMPANLVIPPENIGYSLSGEETGLFKEKYLAVFPNMIREMFADSEFWAPLFDQVAPITGVDPNTVMVSEKKQRKRTILSEAKKRDLRRTRTRLRNFAKRAVSPLLDLPRTQMNIDGKRVVLRFLEDISWIIGALDGRLKNFVQDNPAEFDRLIKLLVTGLGGEKGVYSYGSLKNVNQSTKDEINNLIDLFSQFVGTYKAGQSEEDQIAIDEMISSNVPMPRMPRFTPPSFIGPVLEPLKEMTSWKQVRDFLSKLELYVFDFETTGLFDVHAPEIKNDPIQLAIAKAINFQIQSEYNAYINPESPLSQFTLQTIGDGTGKKVTKEFLTDQRSKLQAMKEFLDMVPAGAVLVGHNGFLFDIEVLNRTLRESGLPEYNFGGFIDTYGLSAHVMPRWTPEKPNAPYKLSSYKINGETHSPIPSDSLESLVVYFGLSNNGRHEADSDVVSTVEILDSLLKYAASGKSASGRDFDFEASTNKWSDTKYAIAEEKYKEDVAKYQTILRQSYIGIMLNNASVVEVDSNKIIDDFLQSISNVRLDPDVNRSEPLPAPNIVSQLSAGSYVFDTASRRIGRSYGSADNGLVLVEFAPVNHSSSDKKSLELIAPGSLFNITEDLITKNGMVLDYGMSVAHPELSDNRTGVFSNFEGSGIAHVILDNALYRLVAKDLSVLKYQGTLIATPEQEKKAQDLLNRLEPSEVLSSSFIQAIRKTLSGGAYPRSALTDLIKMLVNAENQVKLVELNEATPDALQDSQSSADSIAIDEKSSRKKISFADLKNAKVDTSLIEKNMPNVVLTDEVLNILKAVAIPAVNKGKSLNKTKNNIFIPALAGTGKTTTLEAIAWELAAMFPELRALYNVFGKANQEQAELKLGQIGNVSTGTLNALAFNASANADLSAKYVIQGEGTGEDLLNPSVNPRLLAETFATRQKYSKGLLDKYGIELDDDVTADITSSNFASWAYEGLKEWMNSGDRDMSPTHFRSFLSYLETSPHWSPGGAGYVEKSDVQSFTPGEEKGVPGYIVSDKVGKRRGDDLGERWVKTSSLGKIVAIKSKKEYEKDFNLASAEEQAAMKKDWSLKEIYRYNSNSAMNDGFFIDELISLAQEMWDDILKPHDPDAYGLSMPVTQEAIVKNWSTGNVDLTAVTPGRGNSLNSIQGLKDVPNVWLIDEAQDLSPVFIDILKRQQTQYDNGVQIVVVGDRNQAIYQYAGRENAMEPGVLPDSLMDGSFPLTTNYRSPQNILDEPNKILGILGSPDKLVAASDRSGRLVNPNTLIERGMWVITRSNGGIIQAAVELKSQEDGFKEEDAFAVLPNLKRRLQLALRGLIRLADIENKEKLIEEVFSPALEGLKEEATEIENQIWDLKNADKKVSSILEQDNLDAQNAVRAMQDKIEQTKKELAKLVENPPKNIPAVLKGRGITLSMVRSQVELNQMSDSSGNLDLADISIILKLAANQRRTTADGKERPEYTDKALRNLRRVVDLFRVLDEDGVYGVPEIVGKAGGLGGKLAYQVSGNKLQIMSSKDFMKDPNEIYGVYNNRAILESIGFKRVEKKNPDDEEEQQPYIWERLLNFPDDEQYVKSELESIVESISGRDAAATILTGHTAKGLEHSVIRLWKDWNPTSADEDKKERDRKKEEAGNKRKLTPEQLAEEEAEEEAERVKKQLAKFTRAEINLIYVALTRATEALDVGGLAKFLTPEGLELLRRALELHEGKDDIAIDEMTSMSGASQGDYYDRINKVSMDQKTSRLTSLDLSLKTPQMQRIIPFRYATNADIEQDRQETLQEIYDLAANPGRLRAKDESNRSGLLAILDKIKRGGLSSLSDEDRRRLYTYLGSSSLGANSALGADPTSNIEEALAELNQRLGIE